MLTLTPVTSRILALIVSTGLFAGTWANDHPQGLISQKDLPLPKNLAVSHVLPAEPEWIPISKPMLEMPVMVSQPASEIRISAGSQQKTFEVDGTDLLIADEVLELHLEQLPLGLPVGRYRIVDELGGVGWLTVESTQAPDSARSRSPRKGSPIVSTTVDDATVQFIRIANPPMTASEDSEIR